MVVSWWIVAFCAAVVCQSSTLPLNKAICMMGIDKLSY